MSDRLRLLRLVMLAAMWLAGAARPVDAQRADSLRQALATMEDSAKAARSRWQEMFRRGDYEYDDSLVTHGLTILFVSSDVSARERRAVARGIDRAWRSIEARLPGGAKLLLQGDVLGIRPTKYRGRDQNFGSYLVAGRNIGTWGGTWMPHPFTTVGVAEAIEQRAGQQLAATHPAVARAVRGAGVLRAGADMYRTAALQLAGSRSSVARRCRVGVVAACRATLGADARQWWDAREAPTAPTIPVTNAVHGSLLTFALERRGTPFLEALLAAPRNHDDFVGVLSAAYGTDADTMVEEWLTHLRANATQAAGLSPWLALSSLCWALLLVGVVASRRPQ